MRKFKLIKEYPGSPKLGTILHECGIHFSTDGEDPFIAHRILVLEYTEYFEEIKDEYPKIISFRNICSNTILTYEEDVNRFNLKASDIIIYQVATSKTDVWTIGDRVKFQGTGCSDVGIISKFEYKNQELYICSATCEFHWKYIKKAPTPLFTTEDGIEILDLNENVVCVNTCDVISNYKPWNTLFRNVNLKHNNFKLFKSLEKAEQWVKYNKPRFSIKDIKDAIDGVGSIALGGIPYVDINKVKQKLGI